MQFSIEQTLDITTSLSALKLQEIDSLLIGHRYVKLSSTAYSCTECRMHLM
uniref:Uncharacterized protein n=1 Tax=Rhizophora mucronata TaxID=61149 RepID=A0A2P2QM77_RHIMU